jgi:hypothetical protein
VIFSARVCSLLNPNTRRRLAFHSLPPPLPKLYQCFSVFGCSQSVSNRLTLFLACVISSTLKMEATHSSETSVCNKPTRHHIPEDGILHSHRRENLKSYISNLVSRILCRCTSLHLQTSLTSLVTGNGDVT